MNVGVPDAPLTFAVPPGWPILSEGWVRAHQGLIPSPGWVPVASTPPAPAGWEWWGRHPQAWPALANPVIARPRRAVCWGVGFLLFGAIATTISYTSGPGGSPVVIFWGAIVFGPVQAITGAVRWRQAISAIMVHIRETAPLVTGAGHR
jgi:hypothetical protein